MKPASPPLPRGGRRLPVAPTGRSGPAGARPSAGQLHGDAGGRGGDEARGRARIRQYRREGARDRRATASRPVDVVARGVLGLGSNDKTRREQK